jgi:hypothetical protein
VLFLLLLVLPLARLTIQALLVLLETDEPDQSGGNAEISSLKMLHADAD